jgi:hypothetical protein
MEPGLPARRRSRRETLALRRELLVATATLQRLRLAHTLQGPGTRWRALWRGAALAASVLGGLFARRGAARWIVFSHLLTVLRDLLARGSRPD